MILSLTLVNCRSWSYVSSRNLIETLYYHLFCSSYNILSVRFFHMDNFFLTMLFSHDILSLSHTYALIMHTVSISSSSLWMIS